MSARDVRESGVTRFKPYPVYKDSGVEWLGEIPAHWMLLPVKRGIAFSTGWTPPTGEQRFYEGDRLWANISDLGPRVLSETQKTISDEAVRESGMKASPPGSLLFAFKLSVGAVSITGASMYTNEAIATFLPGGGIDVAYLYWASPVYVPQNAIENIYGAQLLSRERIANAQLGIPSAGEQRSIAVFLDRETGKIDALVAKKERLIELLQEKRTALITQAVTKGLPSTGSGQAIPKVPMKDSGVEWLGEIPAHWESLSLARVTLSRCDGPFGSGLKSEHYSASGIRVVRLQNIGWTEFLEADRAYLDEAYASQLGDHSVKADDLLIAGLGDEGHPVGRACTAPGEIEPAMVKADCFRFRLDRRRVLPRFLAFQLSATASAAAGSLATGATRARMNLTTTASRKVALPPLDEQRVIVNALDREGERYRSLVAKVRSAIDRLKELRTALISAAVTGKIDVREEAAA